MWIRQLINRVNHRLSLRESADPTSFVYMQGRFECLDPKLLRKHELARACIAPLKVELPTLKRYTGLFTALLAHPLATTDFDFASVAFKQHTTTVDAFFRDSRGHLIDVEGELRTFKTLGLALLRRYEELVKTEESVASYNARKLKTLLYTTAVIADQLRTYSLK